MRTTSARSPSCPPSSTSSTRAARAARCRSPGRRSPRRWWRRPTSSRSWSTARTRLRPDRRGPDLRAARDLPGGIAIQGAEQFEQTVEVGEQPYLPTRWLVSYNDGSRDNQADRRRVGLRRVRRRHAGRVHVTGDLVLPDYVSEAGHHPDHAHAHGSATPPRAGGLRHRGTRCLAGKATLAVRAVNDDDGPLDVELATPSATRRSPACTRQGGVPVVRHPGRGDRGGDVTVTATDGGGSTTETSLQYPARTCG